MKIYPAILTDSIAQAQDQIEMAQELSDVETVQVDIIDGRFVDNLTITPADFAEIEFGELTVDLHVMTEEPLDIVYELIEYSKVVPVRAVIGQVERMTSQKFFLEEVEKHEWMPGLSLDIFTPIESIDEESWQHLKIVQLMAIETGFQGQSFNELVLEKIEEIQTVARKNNAEIEIIIDGGVNEKTIKKISGIGVDGAAVGSALWQAQDKQALITNLQTM